MRLHEKNLAQETFFDFLARRYEISTEEATSLFYMSVATPRLLSVACEEAYRVAVKNFSEAYPDKMKLLNIQAGKLQRSGKNTPEKTRRTFSEAGFKVTARDIMSGVEEAMKSETAEKEIQANARFYEQLPAMMEKITGSAFVDDQGRDENGELPTQKVEIVVKHIHAVGAGLDIPPGTNPANN